MARAIEINTKIAEALENQEREMQERAASSKARWKDQLAERNTAKKEIGGLVEELAKLQRQIEKLTGEVRPLEERIGRAEHLINTEGAMCDAVARAEADYKSDQFRADSFLQDKIKTMVGG
mgnify:CR=1 FL=1